MKSEDWVIVFFVLAVLVALFWPWPAPARGFNPTPLPYSCDQVRFAFKHFTKEHLLQIANGLGITVTASQRAQAMRCLHGKG